MRIITITGRLTRDAQHKTTTQSEFCAFSVAADDGFGDNKTTLFFDCTKWGKGAAKLTEFLQKGTAVTVSGSLGMKEADNGKTYLQIRVNDVDIQSRRQGDQRRDDDGLSHRNRDGFGGSSQPSFDSDLDDNVPFITMDIAHENKRRRVI